MNTDVYVIVEHLQGQVTEISYMMLAAGHQITAATGGDVIAVLLGHDARELANDLKANRVMYIDHPALTDFTPDAYHESLVGLLQADAPRVVLLGDTSIGAETAGALSGQLDLPLVSHCRTIEAQNGGLAFGSQICGGKIMVEGELPAPAALVTMIPGSYKPEEGKSAESPSVTDVKAPALEGLRVTFKGYIEPDAGDVDIATEEILVAVGRGIQREDNIELAEELAEALGGTVCASRPVVDQGWLPTTRLVGKSGKSVKPTIYLALGISGAPEHAEGIASSNTIVAVNTDPAAPIFDVAQYGAELDVLDLLPVLTEHVQRVKGG